MEKKQNLFKATFLFLLLILFAFTSNAQVRNITGKVIGDDGIGIPSVTILERGTTNGTISDPNGNYSLTVSSNASTLVFSFIGMEKQEIEIGNQAVINVTMKSSAVGLDEVVVVGYGTQKKSDITGSVASIPTERLAQVPVVNVAQALQGAIPGMTITTNSAGAEQDDLSIMIRGQNSITASNTPLIVVDGIPYSGSISEIVPEDVQSIEVLKDASAAAIYGSRGANGVILITTKKGITGKPTIKYSGYYGIEKVAHMPPFLTGPEFYEFKMERDPTSMTTSEQEVYDAGEWTNWVDLATQTGHKQNHTLSISGATDRVNYYISGTLLDVKGIAVNDLFKRYSTRLNVQAKITDWLTIGTGTQLSLTDRAGLPASWNGGIDGAMWMNPLTKAYDDNGDLTIYPWPEDNYWGNPLAPTLYKNKDNNYKIITNNYLTVDFPFVKGLQYKLNTGVEYSIRDVALYQGRDTRAGTTVQGSSDVRNRIDHNYIVENILTYNRSFGVHNIFLTGLYSYQNEGWEQHRLEASGFPNDVLTWHQAVTGNLIIPSSNFEKETLVSQMLRLNYGYDSRYLITMTARRDGFSGFGANSKWGVFPSVALGWNIAKESFFSGVSFVNTLKMRASWGVNGNQAVGPYETLARLSEESYLNGTTTAPGYIPSKLGNPELGWESSTTLNVGLDFGFLSNRITGTLDVYNTNTDDLLLDRKISSVHGITSITQNIGATNNKGVELALSGHIINNKDFNWKLSGTFSAFKNKIVRLYGNLDEDGNEMDDILNGWFIDKPIRVIYAQEIIGVWQLDEVADIPGSAQPTAEPGYTKIRNINGDSIINADDRVFLGQRDPKTLFSMTNEFSYKRFSLSVYIYGVTGVTKANDLKTEDVWTDIRRSTIKKNWWTPDNPTNDFHSNSMYSGAGTYYENASFLRLKDVSLSYDLPPSALSKIGFDRLRVYVAGRNLMTLTQYEGMDPEFNLDRDVPLEREFLVGLIFGF